MASEIQFVHTTGRTCYAQLRNQVGQIYNTVGAAFEAYNAANVADYDLAATEQGASGLYAAAMPAVAEGVYNLLAKERAGGSPAESDPTVGEGDIRWGGAAAESWSQPGQVAPPLAASLGMMVAYLYKAFRNQKKQSATVYELYNDDAVTVDQKAAVAEAAGVVSFGELTTGP